MSGQRTAHAAFSSVCQEILEGWDLERIEAKVFHHYRPAE